MKANNKNNKSGKIPLNKLEKINLGVSYALLFGGFIFGGIMSYETKDLMPLPYYGVIGMGGGIVPWSVAAISYKLRQRKYQLKEDYELKK